MEGAGGADLAGGERQTGGGQGGCSGPSGGRVQRKVGGALGRVWDVAMGGVSEICLSVLRRPLRYVGTPRNIYRHVIMADLDEVTSSLPRVSQFSFTHPYNLIPPASPYIFQWTTLSNPT